MYLNIPATQYQTPKDLERGPWGGIWGLCWNYSGVFTEGLRCYGGLLRGVLVVFESGNLL